MFYGNKPGAEKGRDLRFIFGFGQIIFLLKSDEHCIFARSNKHPSFNLSFIFDQRINKCNLTNICKM